MSKGWNWGFHPRKTKGKTTSTLSKESSSTFPLHLPCIWPRILKLKVRLMIFLGSWPSTGPDCLLKTLCWNLVDLCYNSLKSACVNKHPTHLNHDLPSPLPSSSHSSRGFCCLFRHRGSNQDVVFVLWLKSRNKNKKYVWKEKWKRITYTWTFALQPIKETFQQQTHTRREPEFGIIKWLRKDLRQDFNLSKI